MKYLVSCYLCLMCLCCAHTFAQTVLSPGDIAVIGYNFKDPDQFSFIFLTDVQPGTVVYFTDCGYDASAGAFRMGEGMLTYTVPPMGHIKGEVLTYPDDPGFVKEGKNGFFGFNADGDQIIVFQGSFAAPVFVFALSVYSGDWQTGAGDNNTSSLPPGLTDGTSAIALTGVSNGQAECSRLSTQKELFLAALASASNWDRSNSSRYVLPEASCINTSLKVNPEVIVAGPDSAGTEPCDYIELYAADGRLLLKTTKEEDALSAIEHSSENMIIFILYYPDRREVYKRIR